MKSVNSGSAENLYFLKKLCGPKRFLHVILVFPICQVLPVPGHSLIDDQYIYLPQLLHSETHLLMLEKHELIFSVFCSQICLNQWFSVWAVQ